MTDLLNKHSFSHQNINIGVVHRGMIFVVLDSLGLFFFLTRLQLERLTCSSTSLNKVFIRILSNSRPIPIPGCSHRPDGFSCPYEKNVSLS